MTTRGAPEEEVETPGDDQGAPEEEVETPGEDQTISLENGTYSMDLEAWHNEEDKLSSMDKYLAKPVQLDVDGNRRLITLTIKNQSQMKSFQVEQNGAFIDAKVLGTDEEADTRTVQFAYPELSKPLQAKVGVQVGSYGNTYDLRLVAKTDSIQKITDEEEPADPEPETPDEEVKQPDDPELQKPNPETPPVSDKELQDGRYHIDVKVLKDGTNEISVMQDYIVSPAELDVKDGNSQILLTLKNSSWITMLQVMQEGEYKDVKVEKMNAKQDTSVVSFFVEDLSKKLDGKVKVDIDALNYHNKYNVQFQFDKDSIRKLGEKPDNQNNNGKLPIQKNDPNSNHQGKNGNSNDINKTDDDDNNLNYDRNGDQLKPKQTNNNQLGSTNRGAGTNPQTGDLSGIGVYILLMAASMIVVIRKWRAGTF
ncbi:NEAT domain-containing protein [Virgibacillus halophilus]|uniref:NEAT domain-containing protein n=1 Tax=Tigheibacillus halophilus TaxID=361280 RepID=A0ABU5C3H7_9BACI|nr:NEAT domain-containing protein [Virgibacillus halophilus]